MDEFKLRAGEKFDALHEAAKAAANGGKNRVQDVASQTTELVRRIREAFQELWQNELFVESRERVLVWTKDAVQRIKDGAPPLSPVLLYEELVALFKDRMWRRSVALFACGALVGGGAGLVLGLRAAGRSPAGPHARALLAQPDRTVLLVDDAVTPGAGPGEVLIRVQAFSVCACDRAVLRGRAAALRPLVTRSPLTIGRGFAGVVLDAGPGVSLELGDEVWGCVSEWSGGAATELLTIRSTRVSKRPRGLAADAAASLPWAGTLSLEALDKAPYGLEGWKGKRSVVKGLSQHLLIEAQIAKKTSLSDKGTKSDIFITFTRWMFSDYLQFGGTCPKCTNILYTCNTPTGGRVRKKSEVLWNHKAILILL
ncbi:PREDICTED: uncharacterized protein LOC106103164 [Papilio polytes]|uniref:uncharacterized protein LOC106103164 n=1 Tax=Papilio polytes TaxID=76194 RepID=UPI0006767417|nr:PREDICTED: uncharacterized protein LOC106103164 [Papilio polytes]